jgi:hypothetical protein
MAKARSVRRSPHREVITELLLARWPAERVREYLVALHRTQYKVDAAGLLHSARAKRKPAGGGLSSILGEGHG